MKTSWDPGAKASFRQIARYINSRFGRKTRQKFIQEVKDMEDNLKRTPNLGSIDPLFSDRPIAYRSVVINGLSKMVYYVKDDTIRIAAFWDTRQEPNEQRDQTIARIESDESRERKTEGQPAAQAEQVKE